MAHVVDTLPTHQDTAVAASRVVLAHNIPSAGLYSAVKDVRLTVPSPRLEIRLSKVFYK